MLSQKRNTTTVQQKSLRVREREIQKIDLQAIREGNAIRTGAAALLCCFSFPYTSTEAHTCTHRDFRSFRHWSLCSKSGGENPIAQLNAGDQRMCQKPLRVSQAHFVLRGEAVGQVVAFCQQVKIHCKVPTFPTAPAVAPKFSGLFALLGCGQWARWGEEVLPASCALMPVLYSAGLMVALYPPLACSVTPVFPSLHI